MPNNRGKSFVVIYPKILAKAFSYQSGAIASDIAFWIKLGFGNPSTPNNRLNNRPFYLNISFTLFQGI